MAPSSKMVLQTTGIGSVPFEDMDEAIAHSLKYTVPFLPELKSSENFLARAQALLAKMRLPPELVPWLDALEKSEKHPAHLKVQLAGPVTYRKHCEAEGIALSANWLKDHVAASLVLSKAVSARSAAEVVFFWDEPTLSNKTADADWRTLKDAMEIAVHSKLPISLHACGKLPLPKILALDPKYLSLDFGLLPSAHAAVSSDVVNFIKRGGRLVLGIAPDIEELEPQLTDFVREIAKYTQETWVSSACGLWGWDLSAARSLPEMLRSWCSLAERGLA
jgi:methionine synthase II (cobalamin-independent)